MRPFRCPLTSASVAADDEKARRALLRAKGDQLSQALQTLTDAGDLSLADAHRLLLAFVQRATRFGGQDTKYDASHLQALSIAVHRAELTCSAP